MRACERLADDLAGEVDDGGLDHVVVAEVEGDDVAAVRLDAEQRRRLAGAGAGLAPDLADQPVGDQLGGDRRDGGRRSARCARARSARLCGPSACSACSSRVRLRGRASAGAAFDDVAERLFS